MSRLLLAYGYSNVILLTLASLLPVGNLHAESPYTVAWKRQLGTSGSDLAYGIAADALGNSFVAGSIQPPIAGTSDVKVAKYDALGNLVWTNQLGTTTGPEEAHAVALDSDGNIFLAGEGVLNGTSVGLQDVFLAKLSPAGGLLWARTIGTPGSDDGTSVAVDHNGDVYVGGGTLGSYAAPNAGLGDPFLVKYSNAGNILWSRQIGTSADDGPARVGIDAAGNAYIAGYSFGDWGQGVSGPNGYLVKYDTDGQLLWKQQVGSDSPTGVRNIAVDSQGNSYIIGDASFDAYLAKYDTSGNLVWQRFFGTSQTDIASSVALDAAGNPYVTGWTRGDLGGPNIESDDAFLLKYDTLGNVLWMQQVGSFGSDRSMYVAIDGSGSAYIAGSTDGGLGGPNLGLRDIFVVKFVPEPHALCLVIIGIVGGLLPRRRNGAVISA